MNANGELSGGRSGNAASDLREPGARRKQLKGYWQAAKEMKQAYSQNYKESWNNQGDKDGNDDMPGSFPGASMTRHGDEELVIFPSYARRHVKKKPKAQPGTIQEASGAGRDVRDTVGTGDADFWKHEWEKYEDDSATVDVDVRGWVYTPQKGAMTRKNRLLVSLARQMVGVPAPSRKSPSTSNSSSRDPSPFGFREKMEYRSARYEEDIAVREAESIVKRGEAEAEVAGQGAYSEQPSTDSRVQSRAGSIAESRDISPAGFSEISESRRESTKSDDSYIKPLQKRASWNLPGQMSQEELITANTHLMKRLAPFLGAPLINIPISAFFYNEDNSRQKTIDTDSFGHFTIRAALDFVPTHVRILASDKLSATEEVLITEPKGVSVISDIDDTVKHSAISSGAKEIFRNVFIRELGDLSIDGVREWYHQMSELGCNFHYVSNSPWQLYPALTAFFEAAGLPAGSFHLKLYTGMLQGIFEPVAERKKSTLDKLLRDFPERRFILIGDSGEADLEVYTDVVNEYPGRILGVFIRDITTTIKPAFFNTALGPLSADRSRRDPVNGPKKQTGSSASSTRGSNRRNDDDDDDNDDPALKEAIARSMADASGIGSRGKSLHQRGDSDAKNKRPALPSREPTASATLEVNLIDLDSDDDKPSPAKAIERPDMPRSDSLHPPRPPAKPRRLSAQRSDSELRSAKSPPPPRPRKPSTSVHMPTSPGLTAAPPSFGDAANDPSKPSSKPRPPLPPPARLTYRSVARQKISTAYNRLPSPTAYARSESSPRRAGHSRSNSKENSPLSNSPAKPPVPARKPTTYTGMATQGISSLYSSATSVLGGASTSEPGDLAYDTYEDAGVYAPAYDSSAPLSRKEETWRRRWAVAKAQLDAKGVMLRSWRAGEDVQQDAVALVGRALNEDERNRDARCENER